MPNDTTIGASVKSSASLRIFGTDLDFAGISKAVGIEPTSARRAGTAMPSGQPMPRDLWLFASPLPRAEPLDAHVRWLAGAIGSHSGALRSLKSRAEVRSFCGIIADGESCSFRLSAEALGLFVDLRIDLELSLIFLGSEKPETPEHAKEGDGIADAESETYRTEARVFLDLRGDDLGIAEASASLGVGPFEIHRTGELDARGKPYATALWSLVVPVDPKEETDNHLKWLTRFLSDHANSIRSLDGNIEVAVRCELGTESDTGGLGISPEALDVPVELGLPLEFNVRLL